MVCNSLAQGGPDRAQDSELKIGLNQFESNQTKTYQIKPIRIKSNCGPDEPDAHSLRGDGDGLRSGEGE